jgi:hypothetical protein
LQRGSVSPEDQLRGFLHNEVRQRRAAWPSTEIGERSFRAARRSILWHSQHSASAPIKNAATARNIPQENRGHPQASHSRPKPMAGTCIARCKSTSAYILFSK